ELIAREMTQPAPPQVMLALDLTQTPPPAAAAGNGSGRKGRADKAEPGREHADAIERAISLAASVVCDAHLNGYQIGLAVLGAPAPPFPVHHSLPHRTRMLEALARLDVSKRRERPGPIPAHPSVVVVPYGQDDAPPRGRAMILYAQS